MATVRAPVQVPDILEERDLGYSRVRPMLSRLGYPTLSGRFRCYANRIMGALTVWRKARATSKPEW